MRQRHRETGRDSKMEKDRQGQTERSSLDFVFDKERHQKYLVTLVMCQ